LPQEAALRSPSAVRSPLALGLAIGLALVPAAAQAAEPACLTSGEVSAMVSYALPSALDGVSQRCSAALPADAFLRAGGPALAARYTAARPTVWPVAKAAFLKLGSSSDAEAGKLLTLLPDEAIQQLVDTTLKAKVADSLPLTRCTVVDRVVKLLAPLPPDNMAELLALAVRLGTAGTPPGSPPAPARLSKLGKLNLCPLEGTPNGH
jgi:hypothetical protein